MCLGGGGGEGVVKNKNFYRKTILSHFMFCSRFYAISNFFLKQLFCGDGGGGGGGCKKLIS